MQDYSLNKYHFTENLYDLEFEARKIVNNGKKIDAWYFLDIYASFKRKMPDLRINVKECLEYIKQNQRYKVYENEKIENVIIALTKTVAEEDIRIIIAQKNTNFSERKHSYKIVEDENEVEEFVCSKKIVKEEKRSKQKKIFEHKKQKVNFDYNKNNDNKYYNDSTKYKNDKHKGKNNLTKSLDAYEYSESDESNFIASVKQKSSNKLENKKKQKEINMKTYADYKEMMLTALDNASCFLLTTFHSIITQKHGISFDYKHAPANKRKGVRSKLSLYLDDCDDIFERIQIKNVLFYKRIDFEGKRMIEKRKNTHLRFVKQYYEINETKKDEKDNGFISGKNIKYESDSYKKTMYHLEILIINMFATKTTADISDIEIIFEKVYGENLFLLIQMRFIDLLYKILSPNMILKESKGETKVTLIPTSDIDYKEHGDLKIQREVMNLENKVLSNLNKEITEGKKIEITIADVQIPIKNCDVFTRTDPNILSLLHLLDYNIPKNMRVYENDFTIDEIARKCTGDKFGYKNIFLYLKNNLF